MKKLGLAFFILLFTASTSASWSFTPSKIYLDERGAATFTIKSDATTIVIPNSLADS